MINSVAKTKLSCNSFPPLPQNHSFLFIIVETDPLYQKTHLSMRVSTKLSAKETDGSIQPQVTTFITQKTNLNRRAVLHSQQYPLRESTDIGAKKKEILDAAEILGRKSTLYNQILSASLPKKSQLHCTESAVLFFSFLASSGR